MNDLADWAIQHDVFYAMWPEAGAVSRYHSKHDKQVLMFNGVSAPGSLVSHQGDRNSLGIVIGITNGSISVLWSSIDKNAVIDYMSTLSNE